MRIGDWSSDVGSSDLPDEESEQWVSAIAARVGAPFTVLRKVRHGDRSVDVEVPDLGAWRGRQPVLADDIASSGRPLIEAARKVAQIGSASWRERVCQYG